MDRLKGIATGSIVMAFVVVIVVGGFAVALLSMHANATEGAYSSQRGIVNAGSSISSIFGNPLSLLYGGSSSSTEVSSQYSIVTSMTTEAAGTTTASPPTTLQTGQSSSPASASQFPTTMASVNGSLVEVFTNVTLRSQSPSSIATKLAAIAYSVGGYVAYSSTTNSSAFVVIRVPAGLYQTTYSQVLSLGNVSSSTSVSNDVTIQYTDLQARLSSLQTEATALLRLLNTSTSVNDTLTIESQLQQVDEQINVTESQILQTQRLVSYSTISVTVVESAPSKPLSLKLTVSPRGGIAPLSVTFNAVVNGGSGQSLVNYNFGDGSSQQGQTVIHQYDSAGSFNVTVTVTDSAGDSAITSTIVHVTNAPGQGGTAAFVTSVTNLFVNVVEGIIEVAVVVIPLGLVLLTVALPIRRRFRTRRDVKQE
jgi:hypothetical protein